VSQPLMIRMYQESFFPASTSFTLPAAGVRICGGCKVGSVSLPLVLNQTTFLIERNYPDFLKFESSDIMSDIIIGKGRFYLS